MVIIRLKWSRQKVIFELPTCKGKSVNYHYDIMQLPLQGAWGKARIKTQGVALGYVLVGPSARFAQVTIGLGRISQYRLAWYDARTP